MHIISQLTVTHRRHSLIKWSLATLLILRAFPFISFLLLLKLLHRTFCVSAATFSHNKVLRQLLYSCINGGGDYIQIHAHHVDDLFQPTLSHVAIFYAKSIIYYYL